MELAPTELTPTKLTLKELTLTELALSSPLKLLSPVSAPLRVAHKASETPGKMEQCHNEWLDLLRKGKERLL